MKKVCFLIVLVSSIVKAQNSPIIFASTDTFIEGQAEPNLTIHASTDGDFTSDSNAAAGIDGSFNITYVAALASTITVVYVWTVDANGKRSQYIAVPVETAQSILNKIGNPSTNPYEIGAPKGKKITYKATIMNTNFSVPIARFNFTSNSEVDKKGDIVLFNSCWSWIRI